MQPIFFENYRYVPPELWRWKNFTPQEIACELSGGILINFDALDKLQLARDIAQKPLRVTCAYRSELNNAMAGGAPRSLHMEGRAFDISMFDSTLTKRTFQKDELHNILKQAGFTGFGLSYKTFIHADTGRARSW